LKAAIIDGYLDEPAALGVPPYISPQVRYAAGALMYNDIEVKYFTIDQIRKDDLWQSLDHYEYIIIIAGTTVPGHYLSGKPINIDEINKIFKLNSSPLRVLGGPITKGYTLTGGKSASILKDLLKDNFDYIVEGAVENFLLKYPINDEWDIKERERYDVINKIAPLGAHIVRQHPRFPDVIAEIELSRGCDRKEGFCSFCTEPVIYGLYKERELKDVIEELNSLSKNDVKNIRFGRSSNFLAYGISFNDDKINTQIFEDLYKEIHDKFDLIHTDNANPNFIIDNYSESQKIIETISKYNTSGDILSFGIESFDENVLKKNKISGSKESFIKAIELVNEIGGKRDENGIPKLLPGINLLFGLIGESKRTYEVNKRVLEEIYDDDLMLRRINVRQVMVFPKTYLSLTDEKHKVNKKEFKKFKEFMKYYDHKMLEKVFPLGTKMKNLIVEKNENYMSYSRQLGTYSVICGYPKEQELYTKYDGVVVDHGSRSLTILKHPINLNNLDRKELSMIKGISKKTADKIIFNRSFDFLTSEQKENLKKIQG
jgi:radical SAM superfamily enzyme with C-terminal helix-hairpin-helix motif